MLLCPRCTEAFPAVVQCDKSMATISVMGVATDRRNVNIDTVDEGSCRRGVGTEAISLFSRA